MESFIKSILSKFVGYAFFIGLALGLLCMLLSYTLDISSRLGSLLINLAGDFLMAGLTISVVDKLIKKSERQRLGGVPETAKKAINNEVWQLIGVMSYNIQDALGKTTQEIIDSGLVEEGGDNDNILQKMRIMNLAQLKAIDENKLTLGMFSEMLRFIKQTLDDLDTLIVRYNAVLDSEDIGKAISLRDTIDSLGRSHRLTTLTVPFLGQKIPNKTLDKHQKSAFIAINNEVVELVNKLI